MTKKLSAEHLRNAKALCDTLNDNQKQLLLNVMKDCLEFGATDEGMIPLFAAAYVNNVFDKSTD